MVNLKQRMLKWLGLWDLSRNAPIVEWHSKPDPIKITTSDWISSAPLSTFTTLEEPLQKQKQPKFNAHGQTVTLYNANGGTIVEIQRMPDYNHPQAIGGNQSCLYIINESEDLGTELTKILTLETLRR